MIFFSFSPPPPGVWGFGVWGQGRSPWPQRGPRGAPLFIKLDESLDFRLESKMKFVVATNQILKFHKTKTEPLQMLLAALHSFPWILWVVEISKIGQCKVFGNLKFGEFNSHSNSTKVWHFLKDHDFFWNRVEICDFKKITIFFEMTRFQKKITIFFEIELKFAKTLYLFYTTNDTTRNFMYML